MKHLVSLLGILAATATACLGADGALGNWPKWRGPLGTGVAPQADPPVEWSESKNVKWKVPVPGKGASTPIIWGDQIFLLAAIPAKDGAGSGGAAARTAPTPSPGPASGGGGRGGGMVDRPTEAQRFVVLSYDRLTGKERWRRAVREQVPHEGHHRDHGFASGSPVTDGRTLVAHFGSFGTYALNLEGKPLWEKDLGDQSTRNSFGEGSSPALHGNTVVILWDHEGEDFIVALDVRDGRELWRQPRDEPTGWSTPLVVEHAGKPQVIVNGSNRARAYDLASGKMLWESRGQTINAIPTPVSRGSLVHLTSGWRGAALQTIRLGGSGDVTESEAMVWQHAKNTPYVPSPLLYEDLLYLFSGNNAMLSIFDSATGTVHVDAERLSGMTGVYASPLGAKDRVYLLGRDGGAVVLKKSPKLEVLATNRLDDGFDASPAAVGRDLFLRGRESLYCLAAGSDS
jgi:outer membrane protein assembly factor BamB